MLSPKPQAPGPGGPLAAKLETCRPFLLAIANVEMPGHLIPKGGASDLVQETLLNGYLDLHQFRGRTLDELRAWLRGILLNELASFRRRYGASSRDVTRERSLNGLPTNDHPAEPDATLDELVQTEQVAAVGSAVAQLPEEVRQVLVLRLEHQLPFREIGDRLGRTEEAARKLFTRAIALVRQMTQKHAG